MKHHLRTSRGHHSTVQGGGVTSGDGGVSEAERCGEGGMMRWMGRGGTEAGV